MQRALLIGIDDYTSQKEKLQFDRKATNGDPPRERLQWFNLNGAVHDAQEMRRLLSRCFGFQESGIQTLLDGQATRQGILEAICQHLIEPTRPGDEVVFFYAGHGSQVINPLSDELDKKDESLVPSDSMAGADDIRDKELKRLFNRVIDKGGRVTAILDCCHSGSALRGLPQAKQRRLPPSFQRILDPPEDSLAPEQRGALVISAAQDNQPANEDWDEDAKRFRGAFSLALMRVLERSGSWESAEQVFLRARAFLQARKAGQEPVLAGNAERHHQPVFAPQAAQIPQGVLAAAEKVESDGTIVLQAGWGAGLSPGSELRRLESDSGQPALRIRVLDSPQMASCKAEVVSGSSASISSGDLFELERWAAPRRAGLKVWIPQASLDSSTLLQLAKQIRQCVTELGLAWIDDPVDGAGLVLGWEDGWVVRDAAGNAAQFGPILSLGELRRHLSEALQGDDKPSGLFVHLPTPLGLAFPLDPSGRWSMVETSAREQADYFLCGRMHDDGLEYAWVRPDATLKDAACALPARTDWHPWPNRSTQPSGPVLRDGGRSAWREDRSSTLRDGSLISLPATLGQLAHQLLDSAMRIAKIRSWLTLEAPQQSRFPYRLALRETATGQLLEKGKLRQGAELGLVLRSQGLNGRIQAHFVYVFTIDSFGKATLLYPRADAGSVENRLPIRRAEQGYPDEIPLGAQPLFKSGPPYGIDTYILITTQEAIPNPMVVESEGVRTRGQTFHGLQDLLSCWGTPLRGSHLMTTRANWSIQRLIFESVPGD